MAPAIVHGTKQEKSSSYQPLLGVAPIGKSADDLHAGLYVENGKGPEEGRKFGGFKAVDRVLRPLPDTQQNKCEHVGDVRANFC
eukprot:3450019-Rhodomonas_salina.2